MAKGFSASTVKSWFQYRCERKVRYELSTDVELAAVPVVRDVREQAWSILGQQYEARVLRRLQLEVGLLSAPNGFDALGERETVEFLSGKRREAYAAQVNLRPTTTPPFLTHTGLRLNRNLADLVRRAPAWSQRARAELTVIDVKATRRATAFHKAQVAFYAMVLEARLAEIDCDASVDASGEIWRIPDEGSADGDEWQVERFALAPYTRLVEDFCRVKLPAIAATTVTRERDDTFFHLYFKCEQCSFLAHCAKAADPEVPPRSWDVSAVPGLTHEAKRALVERGISSVGDLARAAGLPRVQNLGWSLSRRAPVLVARAAALAEGVPGRTPEEQTFLMPPRVDVTLLVSIDHDPVDDRIAAFGYRRVEGDAITERIEIPRSGSIADEADALVSVLGRLIADLTEIDARNAPPSGEGIHAHIFFYEPVEATNLQRALGRHLDDPRVRTGLLHLVRLFPPEEVVPEPEFRGAHHLPATAVKSVVEQIWALPVAFAHDLRRVSRALDDLGGGPAYSPEEAFARPLSSALSIDVMRGLRTGGPGAVGADAITRDVTKRLDALQGVVAWIFGEDAKARASGRPILRLNKKPFRFQATHDPLDAVDLDVLTACEILENRAGLLDALVSLSRPAQRRREAGRCIGGMTLKSFWAHGGAFVLQFHVPHDSRSHELGPGDLDLILSDDDPDLRLDPSVWPGLSCRIRPPGAGWEHRRDALQVEVSRAAFNGALLQSLLRRTGEGGWYVDKAFMDLNTARCAAFLNNLARGTNP